MSQARGLDLQAIFTQLERENKAEEWVENIERVFPGKYTFFEKIRIDLSTIITRFTDEENRNLDSEDDQESANTNSECEEDNSCSKIVLDYLQEDFEARSQPSGHFWRNAEIISNAFGEHRGMIALDGQKFVGFMVWNYRHGAPNATIDIVEVKREYRRQGIFKKMIRDFLIKFSDVCVIFADPIPQSKKVFGQTSGWKEVTLNGQIRHMRIVKHSLNACAVLPQTGAVIAICPTGSFYDVQRNKDLYKDSMQYFKIDLDQNGTLLKPIITQSSTENYLGIFINAQLVREHKIGLLFSDTSWFGDYKIGPFVINKIDPLKLLFSQFITQTENSTDHEKLPRQLFVPGYSEASLQQSSTTEDSSQTELPRKRRKFS